MISRKEIKEAIRLGKIVTKQLKSLKSEDKARYRALTATQRHNAHRYVVDKDMELKNVLNLRLPDKLIAGWDTRTGEPIFESKD